MPQRRSSDRTGTACSGAPRFTTNSFREVQAMSGLEKRECDPSAGAGQWAAKRTGQLLDVASGVATSDGLIASGCHWSIPALRGVPTEYQFFGGLNAAARLAKTLVASGIAQADAWSRVGRHPIRHPFHPLRGQRFEVLKARRIAGTDMIPFYSGSWIAAASALRANGQTGPIRRSVCRHSGSMLARFSSWPPYWSN